jgi:hypothetical protein
VIARGDWSRCPEQLAPARTTCPGNEQLPLRRRKVRHDILDKRQRDPSLCIPGVPVYAIFSDLI